MKVTKKAVKRKAVKKVAKLTPLQKVQAQLKDMQESKAYWEGEAEAAREVINSLKIQNRNDLNVWETKYNMLFNAFDTARQDLKWYKSTFRLMALDVKKLEFINPREEKDNRDPLRGGMDISGLPF